MPTIVKRFFSSAPGVLVPEVSATTPLPNVAVGLTPGKYVFNGKGYDCTASGLYRFWNGGNSAIQSRLVMAPGGLYEFLSGVSWHHIHGVEDETSNYQIMANGGMTHKWRLRCGYIAGLMVWYLQQYGLQVRKINLTTLETKNGVDDGHITFEVFHENKWKMWDVTNGCYFKLNGVHLSAAEIIAAGVLNCERVALDADEKQGASLAGPFCMGSYADIMLNTPAEIDAWFARIFQSWAVG